VNDTAYELVEPLNATIAGGGNGRIVKLDNDSNVVTAAVRDGSGVEWYVLRNQGDELTFVADKPAQIVVSAESYPANLLVNLTGQAGLLSTPLATTGGRFVEHWGEIPAGPIDGVNAVFTLEAEPLPTSSLMLYRDGLLMRPGGNDYRLSDQTITFVTGNAPEFDAVLIANYTS
jgi:hypothetical protein